MENSTSKDLLEALHEVTSTITKCEKSQIKFSEGTSQYSLLRNRIKAMYISKLLLENELSKLGQITTNQVNHLEQGFNFAEHNVMLHYTKKELTDALPPVFSVIHKCEKAQGKFEVGTTNHNRFKKIISTMYLSKSLIENQLSILD
jgi:hypothetical protein